MKVITRFGVLALIAASLFVAGCCGPCRSKTSCDSDARCGCGAVKGSMECATACKK